MNVRTVLWLVALFLAVAFDLLFWQVNHGVNVPLFALLCVASGLGALRATGHRPAGQTLWLLAPVSFFSVASALRMEPLSHAMSVAWTLGFMALLAIAYSRPHWWRMTAPELGLEALRLALGLLFHHPLPDQPSRHKKAPAHGVLRLRAWLPGLLRGVLLALPVVGFFALLLAKADTVFGHMLGRWLSPASLAEALFRLTYVLLGSYLLVGVLTFAVTPREPLSPSGFSLPKVLGGLEANILVGAVNLLFALFVAVQLRYFFGGRSVIETTGMSYAEYARRGFAELLVLGACTVLLLAGLQAFSRLEHPSFRKSFQGLATVLVLLVGVILASAFQRLLLYEEAFGFTRARVYAHGVAVWLALAMALTWALHLGRRSPWLPHALLGTAAMITAGMVAVNVDGVIARKNLQRATRGAPLDVVYLASLSADAVPTLVKGWQAHGLDAATREAVGAVLVCWQWRHESVLDGEPWQELHASSWKSRRLLQEVGPALAGYMVVRENVAVQVTSPSGQVYPCRSRGPR
ncbi:MAG: DUF4173 domain-containing protein [Thermoanaerobaculum sp.]|nr:DUF4173 domain-containing protein [Thermoanaerobaculum sp.]